MCTFCGLNNYVLSLNIKQAKVIVISPSVSEYWNEFETMKTKNHTGLKNFKPKIKLNS